MWVKQNKIKPVPLDKMVWRLSFSLTLCIEIINLSLSSLQTDLVKPAAPEEVTQPVFFEVTWAKATSPVQSQQQWRAWSWLQNRPMRLHKYMKSSSQLLQAVLHRKYWFAKRGELPGPQMPVGCNGSFWLMISHPLVIRLSSCSESGVPLLRSYIIFFAVAIVIHINSCILWNKTLKPEIRKKNQHAT